MDLPPLEQFKWKTMSISPANVFILDLQLEIRLNENPNP